MSYFDDLREYERNHPDEHRAFAKKFGFSPKLQKPDKLADYRAQRPNRPEGPRILEPEFL